MTIKIKYIGKHQAGHILEVNEGKAKELLARGDYMMVEDATGIITAFSTKDDLTEKIKKKFK